MKSESRTKKTQPGYRLFREVATLQRHIARAEPFNSLPPSASPRAERESRDSYTVETNERKMSITYRWPHPTRKPGSCGKAMTFRCLHRHVAGAAIRSLWTIRRERSWRSASSDSSERTDDIFEVKPGSPAHARNGIPSHEDRAVSTSVRYLLEPSGQTQQI